jgi:uncharacterized protein (DUF2147 family)
VVERQLPKLNVVGSIPIARSISFRRSDPAEGAAMIRRRFAVAVALAGGITLALAAFGLAGSPPAAAQGPAAIVGTWLTENGRSHVRIAPCGDKLCGTIVWLKEPNQPDGAAKVDSKNPDPAKRARPILGLPILWDFVAVSATEWESGRIYNPEDGDTYRCIMQLQADGTLRVRGYVGVSLLGKTQIWTRVR